MKMITSTSNPKIKRLVSLRKKRKARDEERVFLVEGLRMFREAPPEILREVYLSESFYKKDRAMAERILTDSRNRKITAEILSDTVSDYVSDTRTPQGILCVAGQFCHTKDGTAQSGNPQILVLNRLQDPGNLGTIFRAAEGAGVTGIIMDRECVDIYNPKTIRSTMGSVYRMPFWYAENLENAVTDLKRQGIRTYAAHLEGKRDYDQEDYQRPCAFLIGNEGNGLDQEIASLADTYIKIPMKGQVESLNAAVAASLLVFEAARQRRLLSVTALIEK